MVRDLRWVFTSGLAPLRLAQCLALCWKQRNSSVFLRFIKQNYMPQGRQTFRIFQIVAMQDQNLKTFVEHFIEKRPTQDFPHLYIVDKQTGPFRSIQEAINAALPNSLIKISEGFYEENLVINKPLRLEPKKEGEESSKIGVVLLANEGTAVHVKLSSVQEECVISGMKFSHSGNSANNLKKELLEHEHILNIFQHHDNIEQLQNEFVNRMAPNKMESIILLAERGKVKADNCIFSLSNLVKSCTGTIPAIWVEKEATLALTNSEVKGHEKKNTIGLVCRLGTLLLENSILSNHKEGALLLWGIRDNHSKIVKNYIEDNSLGVHLVGEEFKLKIVSNSISRNQVGIKVGLACEPEISRNIITENEQGIEVHSAFPSIVLNKIEKNKQNGIFCRSYKRFLCKAHITKNVAIVGNCLNGVLVEGENNRTQVANNHLIGFNGEAGVKVEKEAFPHIVGNKIYKNHKEGVLVVESSNTVIQKNEISHNIEANVAMGGKHSHHSAVIDNLISDSPGTGLYLVRSGRLRVLRNDFTRNRDGVIILGSQPEIQRNHFYQNSNNGIVCEGHSQPTITDNFITRNSGVGLLLRHNSCRLGAIHSNVIVSNEIDSGLQEYDKELISRLKEGNTIEKEIYYPEGLPCELM